MSQRQDKPSPPDASARTPKDAQTRADDIVSTSAFSARASDLNRLLDGINQSVRTIEAANQGIKTLITLIEDAEKVALSAQEIKASAAKSSAPVESLADLEVAFNDIREQINGLVQRSVVDDVNLLGGDSLVTRFNLSPNGSFTTEGGSLDTDGLGLEKVSFTDGANLEEVLTQIRTALESAEYYNNAIAQDLTLLESKRSFTEGSIDIIESSAQAGQAQDLSEEGVNLLTLKTKRALATSTVPLTSQIQQDILRLF